MFNSKQQDLTDYRLKNIGIAKIRFVELPVHVCLNPEQTLKMGFIFLLFILPLTIHAIKLYRTRNLKNMIVVLFLAEDTSALQLQANKLSVLQRDFNKLCEFLKFNTY